ncbi:hypothetical protein BLNAU_1620 [Blattamonas nauphoetae]|uniref:Uncharacterized protein n=1 Tax=Blattamonas nauphoetae TaxID=2049346 RepID=A0ABQ9YII5_9EUKA|nr:hypothetical protein BLNAU_1620 [Blattamonas nauphoetae]
MEDLISLLVDSRRRLQTDYTSDLIFLEKFLSTQRIKIIPLIEHDLLARIFSVQQPQTVPLSKGLFHLHLISMITPLLKSPSKNDISGDQTKAASLCVERVVYVAKSYLVFILPKENCLEMDRDDRRVLSRTITKLTKVLTDLEQYEAQCGRQLITEREVWEAAWLTETENDKTLESRFPSSTDDALMRLVLVGDLYVGKTSICDFYLVYASSFQTYYSFI